MWLRRIRSKNSGNHTTHFSCSSFKDVQTLCADDCNSEAAGSSSNSLKRSSSIFQRVYLAKSVLRALSITDSPGPKPENGSAQPSLPSSAPKPQTEPSISLPGSEKRVVVYFTSLRIVRSTFDDCNAVRSILSGLRVLVDERDVTMDSRFMEELHRIFGHQVKTNLSLPRVFIDGRYIGGAEEIWRLNETGELKKHVEGLARAEAGTCGVCGGYRFILCDECSGSHKCYSEKGGFRSCTSCNENGLIRCPSCSSAPFQIHDLDTSSS